MRQRCSTLLNSEAKLAGQSEKARTTPCGTAFLNNRTANPSPLLSVTLQAQGVEAGSAWLVKGAAYLFLVHYSNSLCLCSRPQAACQLLTHSQPTKPPTKQARLGLGRTRTTHLLTNPPALPLTCVHSAQ